MGISSNAILFYGYAWEDVEGSTPPLLEGEDIDVHTDFGWEEVYAERLGLARPGRAYPDKGIDPETGQGIKNYTPEEQVIIDEYTAYWRARRELVASAGIGVDAHCHCDYPMPFVCVESSKRTAHRGDVVPVNSLEIGTDWAEKLSEFCKIMGYDIGDQEPGWYLVSYATF